MPELKLARLPDRKPVRIIINVSPDLHQALVDYGSLYEQAYGQPETIENLIPAMLAGFLESDRNFARRRRGGR